MRTLRHRRKKRESQLTYGVYTGQDLTRFLSTVDKNHTLLHAIVRHQITSVEQYCGVYGVDYLDQEVFTSLRTDLHLHFCSIMEEHLNANHPLIARSVITQFVTDLNISIVLNGNEIQIINDLFPQNLRSKKDQWTLTRETTELSINILH